MSLFPKKKNHFWLNIWYFGIGSCRSCCYIHRIL